MQTEREPKNFRMKPRHKAAVYAGIAALALVFISVPASIFFLSNSVNGYLEKRIAEEVVKKYPFYSLKISGLHYNIWRNRIGCDALVLASADSGFSCNIGKSWVSGVGWLHLIRKGEHPEKALSGAVAQAQDISVKFPHSDYGFSCKRLYISMPDGEITAGAVDFKALVDDEHYFAGIKYRSTRFRFTIPECRVTGLAVTGLLEGRGCQIRSIELQEPSLDALVDNYIPVDPKIAPSRMPNETMNSIDKHLQVESLKIINGKLKYGEIYSHGAMPAIVTLDDVQLQADGIANHGKPKDTAALHGQAIFMQGALMTLDMTIPLASPEFSLKYSGSLSAMDINRLNPFLEHSEYLRIDSGVIVQTITYDVQVSAGHASGAVRALYQDLKISILNNKTGSSHDFMNEIWSFITNKLKLRSENMPDRRGILHIGKVAYQRKPQDTFIQFLWFSLRSGVLDVIFM